jgi:hypothetical protein
MLALATHVWNMLGGLDWAGLPVAAELYGITDIDSLVRHLIVIRDYRHEHSQRG